MSVFLVDLNNQALELPLEDEEWTVIQQLLLSLNFADVEGMCRWDGKTRVEVSKDVARKIGTRLEKMFLDDAPGKTRPSPTIPNYIRPIATSNGLWIDPALPILNRRDPGSDTPFLTLCFALFCRNCSGFSIG